MAQSVRVGGRSVSAMLTQTKQIDEATSIPLVAAELDK
jgi:hypothetical protein